MSINVYDADELRQAVEAVLLKLIPEYWLALR
jgi:hypothetical protein